MAADGEPGSLSIGRLKSELRSLGVPHGDCVERSELVARLVEAREGGRTKTEPTGPAPVQPESPDVQRVLACPPHAHHAVLGVDRDADADALKKAYRLLALRLHPDKCRAPHAEEAFKRVSAAYAALQDGRDIRFGEDSATDATYNYGAYSDEAELFRAMFAGDGSLVTRLVSVFRANPWTLLALVSALQSLGNIVSMVMNRPEALLRCVVVVSALYAASDRFKR